MMRERNDLTPETKILVIKLLGAPAHLIKDLALPFYNVNENITVLTLRPDFDLIRRKSLSRQFSETCSLGPLAINLVFDPAVDDQITVEPVSEIAGTKIAHCNASHLDNFEAFSSLIIALGLPDLRLPDDFWMPVESILTLRELEILRLVYQGFSSKKIGEYLAISHRTIELHRQNCSSKLGQITPLLLETLFSTMALETYYWGLARWQVANTAQQHLLMSA